MKNILIIVLVLLLAWVAYGYITKEQVKDLGSKTIDTVKEITVVNYKNIKEGKDLKDFFDSNTEILKNYWINSFDILAWEDSKIKEEIEKNLLKKYNIWSLKDNKQALEEYNSIINIIENYK